MSALNHSDCSPFRRIPIGSLGSTFVPFYVGFQLLFQNPSKLATSAVFWQSIMLHQFFVLICYLCGGIFSHFILF